MKTKVVGLLVIIMLLSVTFTAFAGSDEYGYNPNACIFNGTFENWENFVYGNPASTVDPDAKNVWFLVRKWNSSFDEAMFQGKPPVDGAWQIAHFYEYLSGDKLGWTWNWTFKMIYSSDPIEGAAAVEGMPNFYIVQDNTWLTDPEGNETQLDEFRAIPPSLGQGFYKR